MLEHSKLLQSQSCASLAADLGHLLQALAGRGDELSASGSGMPNMAAWCQAVQPAPLQQEAQTPVWPSC